MVKQENSIQNLQNKAISNVQRQHAEVSAGAHITDNRTEAIMQRKLQALANTNIQSTQLKSLSAFQHDITIQKQSDLEEEEPLEGNFKAIQRVASEEEELLQGKFAQTSAIQFQAENTPNNTGLPNQLKAGIESLGGMTMDHVKVHYNSDKPAQLNAHAYAQGSDIHIAPRQEQHLPHEAWHVVQQAQGRVKPTMQMKGAVNINDDVGLENEADVMGERALQMVVKDLAFARYSAAHTTNVAVKTPLQFVDNRPQAALQRQVKQFIKTGSQGIIQKVTMVQQPAFAGFNHWELQYMDGNEAKQIGAVSTSLHPATKEKDTSGKVGDLLKGKASVRIYDYHHKKYKPVPGLNDKRLEIDAAIAREARSLGGTQIPFNQITNNCQDFASGIWARAGAQPDAFACTERNKIIEELTRAPTPEEVRLNLELAYMHM